MECIKSLCLFFLLLQASNGQRNVFIKMSKSPDSVIDSINSQTFNSRTEKVTALRAALVQNAAQSQGPIINFLNAQSIFSKIQYKSFWASNEVYVKGVPSGVLSSIQNLFGGSIASINDETFFKFVTDFVPEHSAKQSSTNYTWGLKKIQAPDAWAMEGGNNGGGVIVANIDSGVRYTHETLISNYLGENGWFDPAKKTETPNDQNGHGTHVMGTMVGTNGIGVAPGAKWIACKGCAGSGCAESDLKGCGEWVICPTNSQGQNPDCSKTPVVVNNSWGGNFRSPGYLSIIKAWIAAGIVPIFANGNSGPLCITAGSPAYLAEAIGIGSTTEKDGLSDFSSKGPVGDFFGFGSRIKPDLSAPGSSVYSAWMSSDKDYRSISGTSMAAPHVAGVVALMFGANRNLTVADVRSALLKGCTTSGLKNPIISCGPGSEYPNNNFGQGLLNAKNTVNIILGNSN